eukprot:1138995-Pelagomonas_calceolata.AAC.5
MIFSYYKDSKSPEITQFGAVVGPEWRFGGQRVGFMLALIRHMDSNLGWPSSSPTFATKIDRDQGLGLLMLGAWKTAQTKVSQCIEVKSPEMNTNCFTMVKTAT